jgi:hypothetical protein
METNSRSEIEKLLEGEGRRLIQGVRHGERQSESQNNPETDSGSERTQRKFQKGEKN